MHTLQYSLMWKYYFEGLVRDKGLHIEMWKKIRPSHNYSSFLSKDGIYSEIQKAMFKGWVLSVRAILRCELCNLSYCTTFTFLSFNFNLLNLHNNHTYCIISSRNYLQNFTLKSSPLHCQMLSVSVWMETLIICLQFFMC